MDPLAGVIYVLRDLAQRELGHVRIFAAMIVGVLLSYWLADPHVATASIAAFACGEFIDWGLFTWLGKPLTQRLWLSAGVSSPLDSLIFLSVIHRLNSSAWVLMTVGKWLGVGALVWLVHHRKSLKKV